MQPLLANQKSISAQTPMPVSTAIEAKRVTSVSGEAAQLVVASTHANDAGSAAGTLVYFRLTNSAVLNKTGDTVGSYSDTSFAFVTGTILTTQVEFPMEKWEYLNNDLSKSSSTKLSEIAAAAKNGAGLANGDFMINHRTGLVIGKKATTGTSDTVNYKYGAGVASGGGVSHTDDTAFTPGSGSVTPAGFLCDETSTDSVDEGDVGAGRMTADRNQYVTLGYKIAGEDQTNDVLKHRYAGSYTRITSATTTTVKSGAGHLRGILVGTTAAGTITVYDNTAGSGTVIAVLKASIAEGVYMMDANFTTGCTIVTGAASDITVIWS